jgi:phenolic acid decarboxylase
VIFFPRWVVEAPQKIAVFQNPQIDRMLAYRDAGPTYPIELVDSFAEITFVEDCVRDDETVIACGPEAPPSGYTARRN